MGIAIIMYESSKPSGLIKLFKCIFRENQANLPGIYA